MALILKAGKSITNPHTGATFTTAYAVVDHVENNKLKKTQVVRVSIYVTAEGRTAKRRPLATHLLNREFSVTNQNGTDWTDYFAVGKVTPATKNLYKQSYLWLLEKASDDNRSTLLFADWESDE